MKLVKKSYNILLGIVFVLSSFGFLVPNKVNADTKDFESGSGTSDDPYIIANAKQLRNVGSRYCGPEYKNTYFKIDTGSNVLDMEHTNMTPICYFLDGTDAESVYASAFYGHFDGNNTEIRDLSITGGSYSGGLFGATNGAKIANVGLGENVEIIVSGKVPGSEIGPVGGIVGSAWNTEISNVWNKALLSTEHSSAGGIVGRLLSGSSITNAYNTGSVSAKVDADNKSLVGGIAGYISNSTIQNVANYSTNISGSGDSDSIGLLVGWVADGNNTIKNAYTIKENTNLNGWGHKDDNSLTDENVAGYARSELTNQENFYGFDFENVWEMGNEYPVLKSTYKESTYTPGDTSEGMTIKYNDQVIDIESFLYNDGRIYVNLYDFCGTPNTSNICSISNSKNDNNVYYIDKNVEVTGDKITSDVSGNTRYTYKVMHTKGEQVYYPYIIVGGNNPEVNRTIEDDVTNQVADVPSCPSDAENYKCDNEHFYVPVRFLSQSLGLRVEWDGENNTVNIKNNFVETFLSKYDVVTTTTEKCNSSSCILNKDGIYTRLNKNHTYYLNVIDKETNENMDYYKGYSFYDSIKNIGDENNPIFKSGVFTINGNKITVDEPTRNDSVMERNIAQVIVYEIKATDQDYQESDYNAGGYPIIFNNVFVCDDC